jgi:hypothetical protein
MAIKTGLVVPTPPPLIVFPLGVPPMAEYIPLEVELVARALFGLTAVCLVTLTNGPLENGVDVESDQYSVLLNVVTVASGVPPEFILNAVAVTVAPEVEFGDKVNGR